MTDTKDIIQHLRKVAQVGSVCIEKDITVGAEVRRGQDLGHFLCGGSDVILLRSKEQRAKSK